MDDTTNNKEERERIEDITFNKIQTSHKLAIEDSIKRLKIIDERLASHGKDDNFHFPSYIFHLMLEENSRNNAYIKWLLRHETNGLYQNAGMGIEVVGDGIYHISRPTSHSVNTTR